MKELLYKIAPNIIQNFLISVFNILAYKKRYGGKYKEYLRELSQNDVLSKEELLNIQEEKFISFLSKAYKKSNFYIELYNGIAIPKKISDIKKLPILKKEDLRVNIENVYTIPKFKGIVSKTGGTTGKSLEVVYTSGNMQERFAMLDNFRNKNGYSLGERTAWFSGKNILTERDVKKNRFWKTDCFYKIRYYSTFHIKEKYLIHYIENLIKFKPKYIVGFPSTILEIVEVALKNKINFPENIVLAIYPTAETITVEMRNKIENFFNTKIFNQYASSEGAPFIFECTRGNLHLELQSGVFEVLDENNNDVKRGRLIVTSFTTDGTPLIRYDIGDSIELSDNTCDCGNNNPLVDRILGRVDDYLFSLDNGKINLGNISNTTKGVKGIIRFQAIQDREDIIDILIVKDNNLYNNQSEINFKKNWRDRIGNKTKVNLKYVNNIPNEKSGKFRIIKNNLKK